MVALVGGVLAARRSTAVVALARRVRPRQPRVLRARVVLAGRRGVGPRYTLIVLPLIVPLAAPVLAFAVGRWAAGAAAVLGLVLPSMLGTMLNFSTVYIDADRGWGPDWARRPCGPHGRGTRW